MVKSLYSKCFKLMFLAMLALQASSEVFAMKRKIEKVSDDETAPKDKAVESKKKQQKTNETPQTQTTTAMNAGQSFNETLRKLTEERTKRYPEEEIKRQVLLKQQALDESLNNIKAQIEKATKTSEFMNWLMQLSKIHKEETTLSIENVEPIILIIIERLFDVEIDSNIDELIELCSHMINDMLSVSTTKNSNSLSAVLTQVASFLKVYTITKSFLSEIKQVKDVRLDYVEMHLSQIEASGYDMLPNLEAYPFKKHIQLLADAIIAIINKISQDCKEVTDVSSGKAKNIHARFNKILTYLGFPPIDLEIEMDTSADEKLAIQLHHEQQRAGENASVALIQQLTRQEEEDASVAWVLQYQNDGNHENVVPQALHNEAPQARDPRNSTSEIPGNAKQDENHFCIVQ